MTASQTHSLRSCGHSISILPHYDKLPASSPSSPSSLQIAMVGFCRWHHLIGFWGGREMATELARENAPTTCRCAVSAQLLPPKCSGDWQWPAPSPSAAPLAVPHCRLCTSPVQARVWVIGIAGMTIPPWCAPPDGTRNLPGQLKAGGSTRLVSGVGDEQHEGVHKIRGTQGDKTGQATMHPINPKVVMVVDRETDLQIQRADSELSV